MSNESAIMRLSMKLREIDQHALSHDQSQIINEAKKIADRIISIIQFPEHHDLHLRSRYLFMENKKLQDLLARWELVKDQEPQHSFFKQAVWRTRSSGVLDIGLSSSSSSMPYVDVVSGPAVSWAPAEPEPEPAGHVSGFGFIDLPYVQQDVQPEPEPEPEPEPVGPEPVGPEPVGPEPTGHVSGFIDLPADLPAGPVSGFINEYYHSVPADRIGTRARVKIGNPGSP